VWVSDGQNIIPIGGGIRSGVVVDDGFVASDGRYLFPATRSGSTNSYYPQAFERTLWQMLINDKMLAVGRKLQIGFGVQTQLINANCSAQWVLVVQIGTISADTTPATVGLNMSGVTWSTEVFAQPIGLSPLAQSHFFGIRIERLASSFALDQSIYGVWSGNNAAAPASANFAIRARLERFDCENIADPRGWLAMRLIGEITTDDEGNQETKPAQARIY
jgi:hypothetical protein